MYSSTNIPVILRDKLEEYYVEEECLSAQENFDKSFILPLFAYYDKINYFKK